MQAEEQRADGALRRDPVSHAALLPCSYPINARDQCFCLWDQRLFAGAGLCCMRGVSWALAGGVLQWACAGACGGAVAKEGG